MCTSIISKMQQQKPEIIWIFYNRLNKLRSAQKTKYSAVILKGAMEEY